MLEGADPHPTRAKARAAESTRGLTVSTGFSRNTRAEDGHYGGHTEAVLWAFAEEDSPTMTERRQQAIQHVTMHHQELGEQIPEADRHTAWSAF